MGAFFLRFAGGSSRGAGINLLRSHALPMVSFWFSGLSFSCDYCEQGTADHSIIIIFFLLRMSCSPLWRWPSLSLRTFKVIHFSCSSWARVCEERYSRGEDAEPIPWEMERCGGFFGNVFLVWIPLERFMLYTESCLVGNNNSYSNWLFLWPTMDTVGQTTLHDLPYFMNKSDFSLTRILWYTVIHFSAYVHLLRDAYT